MQKRQMKKNGKTIEKKWGKHVFQEKEASNHLSFFLSFFLTSPQSAMSTWDLKASVLMRAFSSLPAYSCTEFELVLHLALVQATQRFS